MSKVNKPELVVDGRRTDGRGLGDLRSVKIESRVLKNADGSAMVEWGNNKVIAGVYGPREVFPKHFSDPFKAIVNFRYVMCSFSSLEEHSKGGPNRRSVEISKIGRHVFENLILTEQFPNTTIDIDVEVLQSDGGTRVAAFTAASVALVDAGVPVKGFAAGVSVGKVDGQLAVDLNKVEDNYGESDMPVMFNSSNSDILLLQMDGLLTRQEFERSIDLCFEASKKINTLQVESIRKKME
jgi:exosome complex component RRP41